jgi:hypothetical protein
VQEAIQKQLAPKFIGKYPCVAASGLAKKLEEFASTAPSGNLPCNQAIVHHLVQRIHQASCVPAAVIVPQVFDL